jgi:hypothetical protein
MFEAELLVLAPNKLDAFFDYGMLFLVSDLRFFLLNQQLVVVDPEPFDQV